MRITRRIIALLILVAGILNVIVGTLSLFHLPSYGSIIRLVVGVILVPIAYAIKPKTHKEHRPSLGIRILVGTLKVMFYSFSVFFWLSILSIFFFKLTGGPNSFVPDWLIISNAISAALGVSLLSLYLHFRSNRAEDIGHAQQIR